MRAAFLVDEYGAGTTKTPAQMTFLGTPICIVDENGLAEGGSTIGDIRKRGVEFFCPVDENGDAESGSTIAQLGFRGIPAYCIIDDLGEPSPLAPGVEPIALYDEDGAPTGFEAE